MSEVAPLISDLAIISDYCRYCNRHFQVAEANWSYWATL